MARQIPLAHPLAARQPDLQIKFHGVYLLALHAAARREKVDDFYAARTANMAALPWSNFAPPFPLGNVPFDVELLGLKGGVALPEP
jgi:hypothetical protein